jgi:hypothetical protein
MLRSEKKVKDLKQSSIIFLQRLWKKKFKQLTTYRIIEYLFSIGLTIEHVKSINFELLVVFLREKSIISATKACLQRIHQLCIIRHGSQNSENINVNVRVFLASFMIAYHPTSVFEDIGTLEKALIEATIPLLTTFQNICKIIRISAKHSFQDVPYELTKDFLTMLFEYFKRFKAWKVPDEAKLTCRLKHALIALYQAKEHLPPNEPEDSKLKIELRVQIERLRNKLQQIAGVDALLKFDEQREINKNSVNRTNNLVSGRTYTSLPERLNNEQLAHELLVNPEFKLNDSYSVENPIFHRIRELFNQTFWNSLEDDLKYTIPSYTRVLRILIEIRDGINDLSGSREGSNILEIIDLDFIKQQTETRSYTWINCMQLISSIVVVIQRIQASHRDNETKEKWKLISEQMQEALINVNEQSRAFCKALEFLLNRTNALRIDAVNARLRLIAPVIKEHGIDYERGKFQDRLDNKTLTLERTQSWIRLNLRHEVALKAVDLEKLLEGKAFAFVHVHSAAILSLITNQTIIKTEMCPETLLFDVHRLSMLQQEFQYIVTSTTILVKVKHRVMIRKKNLRYGLYFRF